LPASLPDDVPPIRPFEALRRVEIRYPGAWVDGAPGESFGAVNALEAVALIQAALPVDERHYLMAARLPVQGDLALFRVRRGTINEVADPRCRARVAAIVVDGLSELELNVGLAWCEGHAFELALLQERLKLRDPEALGDALRGTRP